MFRETLHVIFDNRPAYAVEMPEVQEHPDTARQPVWETDGRGLPWDLGEDGERTGKYRTDKS